MITESLNFFLYNHKKDDDKSDQKKESEVSIEMSIFNQFKKENNQTEKKDKKDMILAVKKSKCPENHPCPSVRVCPVGALSQKGYDAPIVDMEKCIKCGKCVRFCPMRALALE